MSKKFMNINLRLRQNSGAKKPNYSNIEVMSKLVDGSAKFEVNKTGTVFIVDLNKTKKIMAVVEQY